MEELDFLTSNKRKVDLANSVLGRYNIKVRQREFDFQEMQSIDSEEVAIDKAVQASEKIGNDFIIEDSGLYIDALNGFPGALLKYIFPMLGYDKILKLLEGESNRDAHFKGVVAYYDAKKKKVKPFVGVVAGTISSEARGVEKRGSVANNIFIPNGFKKTVAELGDDEWELFLKSIKNEDHYAKFGEWFSKRRFEA